MSLRQRQQPVWHRRRAERDPREAWNHGSEIVAPIEPPSELGEAPRRVLLGAGSECGSNRGFDVGEHGVDCPECGVASGLASRPCDDRLMLASRLRDAVEGAVAVGDDVRPRCHDALSDRLDRLPGEPLDAPELHPAGLAVGCRLDGGDERHLAGTAAPAFAARARATEIGVVHFHPAFERLL